MSQENVETVRAIYDAVARRDADAWLAYYDPDVEWDDAGTPPGEFGGGRVHRGRDALRDWFRDWHQAWGEFTYNCEDVIDAGDQVVSVVTMRGRGRTSGVEVETAQYGVWTLRDGLVVHVVWFRSREEAFARAGLSG
jgi:ketosteroid isomerase-like protein